MACQIVQMGVSSVFAKRAINPVHILRHRKKICGTKIDRTKKKMNPSSLEFQSGPQDDDTIYDVIVVGAGPCGLAAAARLRERTPAALFTDEEHRRYHWIGKHGKKVSLKHVRSGKISTGYSRDFSELKMLVLDATDNKWLGRWNKLFRTYDISHLRSPILWHVDPLERDSLLSHAYVQQRENELVEIKNCVGRELSKHAKKKAVSRRACGGK